GVTAKTLTIGVAVATGTDALATSFGVSGAGSTSVTAAVKAAIGSVNASGGVLGRKLLLEVFEFDAASAVANPESTAATICSHFRDDRKVFALLFDVTIPSLRKCMAEMGSPLIVMGGFSIMSERAYTNFGGSYLYGPTSISTERLARLFVDSLTERRFMSA